MHRAFSFENGNLILKQELKQELQRILNGTYEEGKGNGQYHAIRHLMGVCSKLSIGDCRAIVDGIGERMKKVDEASREFGLKEKKLNPIFNAIKDPNVIPKIIERTKDENPVADGLECPHCGAFEAYKNSSNPSDTNLWFWMIRAYRVDDSSECKNCGKWFN